jgi:transcriptional regulator with XRE-family HTH domain
MTTGAIIRRHRQARGLRQRDLAELVAATQKGVSAWERGYRTPRARYARRLELALGLEPGALNNANGADPKADAAVKSNGATTPQKANTDVRAS